MVAVRQYPVPRHVTTERSWRSRRETDAEHCDASTCKVRALVASVLLVLLMLDLRKRSLFIIFALPGNACGATAKPRAFCLGITEIHGVVQFFRFVVYGLVEDE